MSIKLGDITIDGDREGKNMNNAIRPGQIWKHHEGALYEIVAVAKWAESNDDTIVVYRAVAGDTTLWAHHLRGFLTTSPVSTPRFTLVSQEPQTKYNAATGLFTPVPEMGSGK